MIAPARERSATRALVLGLLALPFGIFAPFAIWAGFNSLRRIRASSGALSGTGSAAAGLAGGLMGLTAVIGGTAYWFLAS
ncbi:MAG: hypothetical protein QOH92_96 [Chloroflexota bacterium]|nr:hypothetical protein [Chloroflexota bacterium]